MATTMTDSVGGGMRYKLLSLVAAKPRTPTELALLEGKHVSHVSRALGELREMGLVERVPSGSREKFYKTTDRGYLIYLMHLRNPR